MKTIQEYFREADKEEIIRSYLYEHPIEIKSEKEYEGMQDLTIGELWDTAYSKLAELIDRIENVETEPADDEYIFFAHHQSDFLSDSDDIGFSLVKKSEVLDPDAKTQRYDYDLVPVEETAGYLVADTYLTQLEIETLLIDYLYESSFLDYDQEEIDEVLDDLRETEEEFEKHKDDEDYFITAEEVFARMEEELGFIPEKRDEKEENEYNKLSEASKEYNHKAFDIELEKVKKLLG